MLDTDVLPTDKVDMEAIEQVEEPVILQMEFCELIITEASGTCA